ncbi:MAG: hypothetical protein ACTSRC_07715 [Candidatus Helarchaeota archaeon]
MKSSRFLGLFLISLFVLSSMLIFFNVVNNSKRDPSVFNDKVLINNSYVNVTHPSDLLLNGNDSTNQTISWTLSESAPYDYLGVYSFTGDGIGSDPTGWVVDEDPSTNVSVLAELDTHQYIVEFLDNTTIGAATMYDVFLSQSAGMIELYMRTSVANSENAFYLGNLSQIHGIMCVSHSTVPQIRGGFGLMGLRRIGIMVAPPMRYFSFTMM